MYGRGKNGAQVPSDAQAREKLIIYVYEYLHHMGAKTAADTFLNEISWPKGQISPNDAPGFLHSWWCVFWDLYCAAPERRESFPHSKEASSFHDYTVMTSSGYPLSPNLNGMPLAPGQPPPGHHPHNMGEGGAGPVASPSLGGHQLGPPGPDGTGLPPGFFAGPPHLRPSPQMLSHGGMMQPSNHQHHPSQQQQQQQLQQQQQQQQQGGPQGGPPTPGHMPNGPMNMNPNSPHAMGMMMQGGGQGGPSPFVQGPRGYGGPASNRGSPAARMAHPGQQMEFSGPPGAMMMDGPPGMMMTRAGMSRGGMPPSPMPPGSYGGTPGPMQRMHNPGAGPGGSPSGGPIGMSSMHPHQQQRQPWQHQGPPMGHYGSTPSPPNGPYMAMMGPPHMQSPSQESVLSGGSENIYGMMKGPDRFGNNMNDGSMGPMVPVDMGSSLNGDGMEMKHSPSINGGSDAPGGRNAGPNSMENVDEYGTVMGQFSSAGGISNSGSSQD